MKKALTLVLAATMTAGLLTGCGGSDETKATETVKTEKAEEPVEVEFWYAGGKTAVGVVQEIIDNFNASQDKYTVTAVTQADYSETYQKLQAGIAGKAAPDLVLLEPDTAKVLYKKGLVETLNGYMDTDEEFQKDDYLPVFFDCGVDETGDVFAMPAYGTTQVLYYNIEAFEKAGVKPEEIKTWQDLAEAAKAIQETGEFEYGWEPMWGPGNLIDAAFSNGASVFNEDGTQVTINSPEWVEVWEAFRTWIHDEKTMAIHFGGQGWEYWYNTIDDVLANKAGGYTGSSGDQADLDFSIVAAMEQPAWDEDSQSSPVAEALTLSVLESSSDEEKQGAYEFMKYFMDAESQTKWTMATDYIAVNTNIQDNPEYIAYTEKNPQALVPFNQAGHGSAYPDDPTNGVIYDALTVAADKVEIDGVSAQEALDEAQKTAQEALDAALGK